MVSDLNEALKVKLNILSVIPISRVSGELDIVAPGEVLAKRGDFTKGGLAQLVDESGVSAKLILHVAAGSSSREISSVAQVLKANLVVVGNVGRTGKKGLAIGNTAEKILKRLAVDALIVRS